MKEIVRKWLYDCLGVSIKMENLGKEMNDGVLLARLLKYYQVVNEKAIKNIVSTDNLLTSENNLRQLNIWFQLLGIKVSNDMFFEIAIGRTTTCLNILYELYLALHNKEKLHFINTKKHMTYLKKSTKITSEQLIRRNTESYEKLIDVQALRSIKGVAGAERTSMLHNYTKKRTELNKRKAKQESLKIKSQISKQGILEKEKERMRNEDIIFVRNLRYSSLRCSREHNDKTLLTTDIQPSTEDMEQRNKLLSSFNDSFKQTKKECENLIMNSVWKMIENKEKEQLKKQISLNLLHQSQYEKQMSSKIFQKRLNEKINREKFLEAKQKIEEESKNLLFFSSCKTSEEEITHQLELIEKIENHRKLYGEKLKRRNRKHYAICQQITSDIIDLAIKKSHFGKENISDEVWSQWKQMFINEEQILELNEDADRKSTKFSIIGTDTALHPEDHDFDEYLHLIGDWTEHAGLDITFDEENILGYIVQRLFGIKYPPPFIQKPAQLEKHKICTILNGLTDESQIIKLKTLLIKSKIVFVDIKSAINYCITCYKNEAGIEEKPKTSKKGGKKTKTPKSKASKAVDSKKSKKTSRKKGKPESFKEDKEVQTTSSLLSTHASKELSIAAKMGNYLFDLENLDDVPISTTVKVLIEFLKSKSDINGWVLVNFPSTLAEAYILEKTLSGKKFPKKFKQRLSLKQSEDLLALQGKSNSIESCYNYKEKNSRLVQFPPNELDNFKTYFTSFILVLTEDKTELPDENTSKTGFDEISNPSSRDMATPGTEKLEMNETSVLTSIYKEQAVLQKFVYETMDLPTIKKLARLIVADLSSVQEIPSVELFGEEILQLLTKKTDPKKKKSPKKTKENPEEIYDMLKQNLLLDEKHNESDTEIDEKLQQLSEDNMLLKPGQEYWHYTDFDIPEDKAVRLATSWEEMEDIYIKKVKEILHEKRNSDNLISLYITYITRMMSEDDEDYNKSQNLVSKYVNYFNSIPKRERLEQKTQEELSCSVFHLEMKLWEITNNRKNRAEQNRTNLINQNWTVEEMIRIVHKYILFLQIEVDRCVTTISILYNYYCLMSGSEEIDFLRNLSLPKITLDNEYQERHDIKSTILNILTTESNLNLDNPLYNIIEDTFKQFRTEINKLKVYLIREIENSEQKTLNKIKEHKEKVKAENKKETPKKIDSNEDDTPLLAEANYIDIKNMFLEWSYAVKDECDRTNCRMEIIMRKTKTDIEKFENNMTTVFHNLSKGIKFNYLKQNENIDTICKIIHAAINENKPVLDNIILSRNDVYTEPDHLIDLPTQPILVQLEEEIDSQCFTIKQLKYISERMKVISPNGQINKNALIYIIQDLLFCEQEKENIQLFPKIWTQMNSAEFENLFTTVFGNSDLVNWKNFIIYSLELKFPEMEDIINYRTQFSCYDKENQEIISYNNFMNIRLWFEDSTENTHIQKIKTFLFSLFQINNTEMNYSDFILTFCKDINQKTGFGKGLAYFFGKCVIVSEKELHLEDTLREYNEQQNNIAREILNQIIFDVVNTCAGLTIEEINSIDEMPNEEEVDENDSKQSLGISKQKIDTIKDKSLPLNTKKGTEIQEDAEVEFKIITYDEKQQNEAKDSSIAETFQSKSVDKASQTVSFNQLLYDEYIKINKALQWTSEVPKAIINSLLQATIYPALQSQLYEKEIDDIIWKMKRTLDLIEDEFVYIPWLMDQNIMQDIFSYIHSFKIFSFPSIIKEICEHPCT